MQCQRFRQFPGPSLPARSSAQVNQYGTISYLHDSRGVSIGQHPTVTSHLVRGIYNRRPPKPKYSTMWDVGKVTDYFKHFGANKDLSLKQLSGKLAMLMSLVGANRSSELAALDL